MLKVTMGLPQWLSGKESAYSAGVVRDVGSIPGWGRSPGGGHGNPLQYSCLENSMDRGAWWATVRRVAESQARLKQLSMYKSDHGFVNFWFPLFAVLLRVQVSPLPCPPQICSLLSRVLKKWDKSRWPEREAVLDTHGVSSGGVYVESSLSCRFPHITWVLFSSMCSLLICTLPHAKETWRLCVF